MIIPKTKKMRHRRGVTLVGTMVAVVILLIALIGTSSFRYYAALDGRRANTQTTAARIALTLCESWQGVKGAQTYDPAVHLSSDLQITQSGTGPDKPGDFTLLGSYVVALDYIENVNYNATLSWKDVQPGLRALNVIVTWASRDRTVSSKAGTAEAAPDKSFALTVYTSTL
jgi:hypothetical protein